MRKGEIACDKQFLLFSQCFLQLYIFSASKCGICDDGLNVLIPPTKSARAVTIKALKAVVWHLSGDKGRASSGTY